MNGQVLRILLPTENTGFKIIEMDNWNARIFVVPRANLPDLKDRTEANNPSLYFLFGDNDESTGQKLYIGETEKFVNRLVTHNSSKDFWNTAVGFIGGL